jgi:ADP-heptose:LPS heptosyltransferase
MIVNLQCRGIGDSLLALYAIGGLKQAHPDQHIVYSCANHDWVRLFKGGYDELIANHPFPDIQLNAGYNAECREHTIPRWQRYCNNAHVSPVAPVLKNREALLDLGERWNNHIALGLYSDHQSRSWGQKHIRCLIKLLKDNGMPSVLLHNNLAEIAQLNVNCEYLCNQSPEIVASCLLNAKIVVAVDSAIAHLHNLISPNPMIVLLGPTEARMTWNNPVIELKGKLSCQACWFQYANGYDQVCAQQGCASLRTITPQDVLDTIRATIMP